MSLLSIFKPKHKIDWQKRQDLLIQLELVWGSVSDYRFGQFITKVYESYRTRCFGMERVRYMDELSETDWLNILHFCSRDPNWKMGEFNNDLHPSASDPKRIRELITHLGSYWRTSPLMKRSEKS